MSIRRRCMATALVLASCGAGSDIAPVSVTEASSVERPTEAEIGFAGGAHMYAAWDELVLAVDTGGISAGPDGVTVTPSAARVLDLTDGSVREIDLPGDGHLSPLAVHADSLGAVVVVEDCPEAPTGENQQCDDPTIGSFRLSDPTAGWTDLGLDLDVLPGAFTGVFSMVTSTDGLTAVFRTQDATRTYRHLARLDDDSWRVLVALPDETTDACRTERATFALVKGDPGEVSGDPARVVSPVSVVMLDDSGEIVTLEPPPIAEGFGAVGVAMACDADGAVLASAPVGDTPAAVYQRIGDSWVERPDLIGGDSFGFPFARSSPIGVQLTWTDVDDDRTFTVVARKGDGAVSTDIAHNAVVVQRPDRSDLVLLPLGVSDEPESAPDPESRLTEVTVVDPYR